MQLEDQIKALESQLYPERVKEIAHHVQSVSVVNSESEEAAAVASLVDDEVIAETIEIETHSCPGSPSSIPTTIVISAPVSSNTISTGPHTSTARVIHVTESTERNKSTTAKAQQPAAIALPIDMPFIGGTSSSGGTVTLQIIAPAGSEQAGNASNTSRHNLETIVEAIRHLEGDHLFKDEDAVTVVKQDYEGEEIVGSAIEEVELSTSEAIPSGKTVKHVLTVSPEQLGAIRQQVIQCLPIAGQSRPGVIVAKNP
jgi:hypothetical protein